MTARDLAREALELAEKATAAPWIIGDVWRWAGVMPERHGDGKCAFCKTSEPTWVGQADINGEMMLAHRHRYEGEQDRHSISGPEDGLVAGNYDYDTGGIVLPVDAAFICFARSALPALAERCLALEEALPTDTELDRLGEHATALAGKRGSENWRQFGQHIHAISDRLRGRRDAALAAEEPA